MKYIIFGLGKIWRQIEEYVDVKDIIAFTDNNVKLWGKPAWDTTIIPPRCIHDMDFDKVVVASEQYREDIKRQLQNDLHIEDQRIMDWEDYVRSYSWNKEGNMASFLEILRILSGFEGEVTDIGNSFEKYQVFSKSIGGYDLTHLTIRAGKKKDMYPVFCNVYEDTDEDGLNNKLNTGRTVICCDEMRDASAEEMDKFCQGWLSKSDAVIFNTFSENIEFNKNAEKKWNYRVSVYAHSCIYVVENKWAKNNIKIFVVSHKNFTPPLDSMYVPIHVGNAEFTVRGMVRDDEGDNIAQYNDRLNEATAMYWMWKNVDCEYIGLNHYRRYFTKNNYKDYLNILNASTVWRYMRDYDLILAEPYHSVYCSIENHLGADIGSKDGIRKARKLMEERQRGYLDAFDYVFRGGSIYRCNLFVMKKDMFDRYCEWLFSFLIELCDSIDVSDLPSYEKRTAGFLAERMLTVWLMMENVRIKELPYLLYE